jgi:hypothetical protein
MLRALLKGISDPRTVGGVTSDLFEFTSDNMHGSVNGWAEKLMSLAGKETMIKSVLHFSKQK